jgi:hypothetical protein
MFTIAFALRHVKIQSDGSKDRSSSSSRQINVYVEVDTGCLTGERLFGSKAMKTVLTTVDCNSVKNLYGTALPENVLLDMFTCCRFVFCYMITGETW